MFNRRTPLVQRDLLPVKLPKAFGVGAILQPTTLEAISQRVLVVSTEAHNRILPSVEYDLEPVYLAPKEFMCVIRPPLALARVRIEHCGRVLIGNIRRKTGRFRLKGDG